MAKFCQFQDTVSMLKITRIYTNEDAELPASYRHCNRAYTGGLSTVTAAAIGDRSGVSGCLTEEIV
jgi:hypothetical protein